MNVARIMSMFAIFVLLAVVASTAQSNRPSQTFDTSSGPVKVTPLYHATMLIEAGGKNIYVDPAKPANFSGLPKADLILITDIHGDHMDSEAIAAISKSGTQIFAPPAVVATVTTAAAISNGETKSWAGWTIEAIPMYNLKRGPEPGKLYHEKGRGNGYVLTYGGKRFYISGDTEETGQIKVGASDIFALRRDPTTSTWTATVPTDVQPTFQMNSVKEVLALQPAAEKRKPQ